MEFLTTMVNFLAETGLTVGEGLKYIAAAFAVFTGVSVSLAEGKVACHALDAMARQPEMAGKLQTTMIIGQTISETTGIYGFVIAILIIFL